MSRGNRSKFSRLNRPPARVLGVISAVKVSGDVELKPEDITEALGYVPEVQGTVPGPTVVLTAGEAIGGHRVVRTGSDGKVYKADPNETCKTVFGLTAGAASQNASVTVQVAGVITEPSWNWDPTQPIWLSSGGLLTQVVPTTGYLFQVGAPVGPDKIRLEPQLIAVLS